MVLYVQVQIMEPDWNKRQGLYIGIECINTINEGLMVHHESHRCSKPFQSKYLNFLEWKFYSLIRPKIIHIKKGEAHNTAR